MNASPARLLNGYARTLTQRGEWMRRVAIVGSGHPKTDVLVEDMAGLASDLLGLPVIETEPLSFAYPRIATPSVVLCSASRPLGLSAAAHLAADGHRVIVRVEPATVPDIFDLVEAVHPHQPHRTDALLSLLSIAACLSDAGDEGGMSLLTHVAIDRQFTRSIRGVSAEQRTGTVLNAMELEFHDGRARYGRHGIVLPAVDEAELENITMIGGLGPLSDSSQASTIGTPED